MFSSHQLYHVCFLQYFLRNELLIYFHFGFEFQLEVNSSKYKTEHFQQEWKNLPNLSAIMFMDVIVCYIRYTDMIRTCSRMIIMFTVLTRVAQYFIFGHPKIVKILAGFLQIQVIQKWVIDSICGNSFHPGVALLYPINTSEKLKLL